MGNAAGRALNWRSAEYPGWAYYPNSMWANMLWQGGFNFETPPPMVTKEGFKPFPPTGARTLDSRTAFYYGYTMDSPGMIMRVPNVGSQYLMGFTDADKNPFDGGKTYRVTLPPKIPAAKFWSFTLYDNQTRSMLQTPQRYPRAGSQTYPSPAAKANADGSTTIYFGPSKPAAARKATGSRRCRVKVGSRCCASTAQRNRSSTRPGESAKSSWSADGGQTETRQ